MTENNPALSFLPDPGPGRFWESKYSQKYRGKPLHLRLKESFRPGSPVGTIIGDEFAEANKRDMMRVAELILVRTADRLKYEGIAGLRDG